MYLLDFVDRLHEGVADVTTVQLIGLAVEAASEGVAKAVGTDLLQTCQGVNMATKPRKSH